MSTPCKTCNGDGTIYYANGATWRGGIGGSAVTKDVCNKCWGSGDSDKPGVNLIKLERLIKATKAYMGRRDTTTKTALQAALKALEGVS